MVVLICLCLEIKSDQDVKLLILKKANYWPKTHEKIIVKIDDNSAERKPKPFSRAAEISEVSEVEPAANVPRKYERNATPIPVPAAQKRVKKLTERHGETAIDKFFRTHGEEPVIVKVKEGTEDVTQPVQPLNIDTHTFKKTKARKDKPRDPAKGNKYHSRIRNEESHEMPSFEVAHDRKKQKKKLKLEKLPNPLPQKGTEQWPETTGIDNLGGYYEENVYATSERPKYRSNVKQNNDYDELPKYLYKSEIFYPSHRLESYPTPDTHVFHQYSPSKKNAPVLKPTVTIPETPKSHKSHATSYAAVSNGNSGWKPVKHITNHGGYEHRNYGKHEIQGTSAPDFKEDHENGRYHHTGDSKKCDHSGKENESEFEEQGGNDEDESGEDEENDDGSSEDENDESTEYESESKNTPKQVQYKIHVKTAPVVIARPVHRKPEYKPMFITSSTVQPPRKNPAARPPHVIMSESQEADRPRKVEHPTVIKISTKSKNTSPKDDLKYFQ